MALRSLPLLVLVAVALRESCLGTSSHSLKYFHSSISEPSQGLPHFVSLGYVDDQLFNYYDSSNRKFQPRVPWIEKVRKEDPTYWERGTQTCRGEEESFIDHLEILRTLYNHSGLNTLQKMIVCELRGDGSKGGFLQYGYEGKTFLTFDKETLTWVASEPQAQIIQRKWDAIPGYNQRHKVYLEEECIEWIKKYLSYRKEALLRTEPPVVTMSSRKKEVEDGMEMHICRLHGFYPREIEASWTRDGEVWLQDTLRGSVAPNADGTFHAWLSIQIDPKERGRYRCHVEHDSLQEPLDVVLKDPPMVTVNRTVVENGMEIHVCHMDGFYPKKIDASWRRDGEVWQNDTLHGSVASNADGTFYTWLSIRIDPEERGRYRCHVEHDGLQEPLDVAIKVPESNLKLILCYVFLGLFVCLIVGIGTCIYCKKCRDGYKAPSGRIQG